MQRRFVFIVNPISGNRGKQSLPALIKARMDEAGFPYQVFPSVADGEYSFLHSIIQEESVTDVVIAGGDGSVNAVVNALRRFNVQFGIIPCGSGNGLALSAGIPKNWNKALDLIIAGHSSWTDAFLINHRFACMLCGLGFDAQVAHAFAADPARGLRTYIKQSVKHFFTAKSYPFRVQVQGEKLEVEAFFISIANSNQFGNNVTIAPHASLTDGLLDVVIVTRRNKIALLMQTIKQVSGFNQVQEMALVKKNASVIYFQTEQLTIKNGSEAPMHIDGEPVETEKRLQFAIIKDCFRLIVPATVG